MLLNYRENLATMRETIRSFPWQDRHAYGMYIAQTYYYVCHSTRLLAVAAGRMSQEDNSYHKRFLDHAAEEKGHEMMALKDLKNLGFTLEDFPELPETKMFWETQYYKIEHNDPLSLMGYIMALEAIACQECPWIKDQLVKHHKGNCHTFIRVHGEEDPDHVVKAQEQIDSLPASRLKWVQENFDQSSAAFILMLESIKMRTLQKQTVAA